MKKTFALLMLSMLLAAPSFGEDARTELPLANKFDVFITDENNGVASFSISLERSILSALENNIALRIQHLDPLLKEADIETEKAQFDTEISAEISASEERAKSLSAASVLTDDPSNDTTGNLTLEKKSQTGAVTTFELNLTRSRGNRADSLYSNGFGLTYQQPLQRGAGRAVNTVSLKKAELELNWSRHELEAYVLSLVSEVQTSYWQYYLSWKQLLIMRDSLHVANIQKEETEKRILAGSLSESESAAAEAEVALRKEELINAESNAARAAISLLKLINVDTENYWQVMPILTDNPEIDPVVKNSLKEHIDTAMVMRPELAQAEILLQERKLDTAYSRNGLLPKLDFFITLGKTGYAKSWNRANSDIDEDDGYETSAGLLYELTRDRRAAKAALTKSEVNQQMQNESIKNLKQVVKQDVINAYIEAKRALQQITATAASSQKQQEKLRVEEVKFSVGKTTSFQVAQAQRDLTEAKIAEVQAAVDFTVALIELYRADGSLLERNGIALEN